MSVETPWFTDRFTLDDYGTVAMLRRGLPFGDPYQAGHFEPVLLHPGGTYVQPAQMMRIEASGAHHGVQFSAIELSTARWAFLQRVYAEAVAVAERRYPDLYRVKWVPCRRNWREIVLPQCHADAAEVIQDQMAAIIRRGDVSVQTGVRVHRYPSRRGFRSEDPVSRKRLSLLVDVESLEELWTSFAHRSNLREPIDVPVARHAFTLDDLSAFIVRPSPCHLELLNYWDATPPATEAEERMIEAVERLDPDVAEWLLDTGTDVNAINQCGNTALTGLMEAEAATPELRLDIARRLVSRGADVNLFSYDAADALINATMSAEPATVEWLLAMGADPNHNAWPEENPERVSLALEEASTGARLHMGTPEGEAHEVIGRMLRAAGAVEFRLGFLTDEGEVPES